MAQIALPRLGWRCDLPDIRDYSVFVSDSTTVPVGKRTAMVRKPFSLTIVSPEEREEGHVKCMTIREAPKLPASVDNRQWCSPIENQLQLGACTAHAGIGLFEYFERKAFGKHTDLSRLFLYKVTRNLMKLTGDTGAELRTTMQAMTFFGAPPEEYWPYEVPCFDDEPNAFCYQFGSNFKALQYARLDLPGSNVQEVLTSLKTTLSKCFAVMFGFSVYSNISDDADIPFPGAKDKLEGGHAVMIVGYDDEHKIGKDKGALLIRNSWGTTWGDKGYGWLPYKYVLKNLASDFWTLYQQAWIDSGAFDE